MNSHEFKRLENSHENNNDSSRIRQEVASKPPPLQKNILSKCANHPTKAEFTSATPMLGVIMG